MLPNHFLITSVVHRTLQRPKKTNASQRNRNVCGNRFTARSSAGWEDLRCPSPKLYPPHNQNEILQQQQLNQGKIRVVDSTEVNVIGHMAVLIALECFVCVCANFKKYKYLHNASESMLEHLFSNINAKLCGFHPFPPNSPHSTYESTFSLRRCVSYWLYYSSQLVSVYLH